MRPKKKVLLVGVDVDRASVLKFTLETCGFAVTVKTTAAEALEEMQSSRHDLLLCVWPLSGVEFLIDQIYVLDLDIRTLVLAANLREVPFGLNADAILTRGNCSSAELLERAKVLSARKRGPRPMRKPVAAAPVMSFAERRLA